MGQSRCDGHTFVAQEAGPETNCFRRMNTFSAQMRSPAGTSAIIAVTGSPRDCTSRQTGYCCAMGIPDVPYEDLIACPQCDALYHAAAPGHGERAVCHRCHTVLIAPRQGAGLEIIALALGSVVLVVGARSLGSASRSTGVCKM